jgi:hypothetical protein
MQLDLLTYRQTVSAGAVGILHQATPMLLDRTRRRACLDHREVRYHQCELKTAVVIAAAAYARALAPDFHRR